MKIASSASGPRTAPRLWIAAVVLAAAVAILLLPLDNTYRARWYGELLDAGHAPLFGLLALFLAGYVGPQRQLLMIFFAAVLACGAELVQPLVGRSGSWRDAAYGLLGVAAAAAWLRNEWNWLMRFSVIAVLLAWPGWRAGTSAFDAWWAWQNFPELAISSSPWEEQRWELQGVQMASTSSGGKRLQFSPDPSHGSSAVLYPVVRDWTEYETLEVSFEFEGEPLLFLISVRDGKKLPPELPRFDLWRRYPPGRHDVRIDLGELARGGNFPPIELDRVQSFHLVAFSDRSQSIIVHRISLSDRTRK
ncbi:MAG: hypothetical protein MUF06_01065 [Pirellulaceae bacterium]|jgi:hypothetical protein|nr:hypothetical protein [Pirellulaceae bacterium]